MQGGVNSKITITAYTIISLISSSLNDITTKNSITKGLKYLEKSLSLKSIDTYALGLINYALNIGKSNLADAAFKRFDALANRKTPDQIYWPTSNDFTSNDNKLPNFKAYYNVPSSDIEITSYGLLTYLLRKNQNSSLLIVKWLISKSNSLGTYSSTQNTILALESLAQFGISLISNMSNPLNVSINVKVENSNSKTSLTNTFNINDENSLILQSWDISDCNTTMVTINATGNGIVSFKTIVNYNLFNVIDNTTAISVTQSVVTKDFKNKNIIPIRTCAKYANPKKTGPKSGMFIVESELFGGFDTYIDKNKVKNNLKLVEINQYNKVSFYFDYLNESLTCIDWQMIRTYPVSNLKPITVSAYDYYNPIVQKRIIFKSPSDYSSANICKTNANLKDCK
jgi:CD109 antigen